MTTIKGTLYIGSNYSLMNLIGLNGLSSIGEDLKIGYIWGNANPSLTSLTGLEVLTSIGGDLRIFGNDTLTNLSGLQELTSIGGDLEIGHSSGGANPYLISLLGLEGLTSIGDDLWVRDNYSLSSLAGLENIEPNSIDRLIIYHNFLLSNCEIESVCAYLVSPNGATEIYDNATGCNSPEEVLDSCEANVGYIDMKFSEDDVFLYPIPASEELNISINGLTIDEVVFYTLTGQQVFVIRPKNKTLDISNLQPGMYIVEVTIKDMKIRQKLLVQ
jgi:hypothetical protein